MLMMVVAVMVVTVSVVFGHNILQRYVTGTRGLPTKNTQDYGRGSELFRDFQSHCEC